MNSTNLFALLFIIVCFGCEAQAPSIGSDNYINIETNVLKDRVQLPDGFKRLSYNDDSFAYFLQHLILKPSGSKVHYYNGEPKHSQAHHLAVLDIDIGKRDLQQCADAIIRLRAEYLYHHKRYDDIQFHFTNGFLANYDRWKSGERIKVDGNQVSWYRTEKESNTYKSFRKYLDVVFSYAGTLSLSKELKSKPISQLSIGDVFIQGGSPGHAVIIVDMAIHDKTGEKIFLMAQSYMPAQDVHIIKKNQNFIYGSWYTEKEIVTSIKTPEWTFYPKDLKSF